MCCEEERKKLCTNFKALIEIQGLMKFEVYSFDRMKFEIFFLIRGREKLKTHSSVHEI